MKYNDIFQEYTEFYNRMVQQNPHRRDLTTCKTFKEWMSSVHTAVPTPHSPFTTRQTFEQTVFLETSTPTSSTATQTNQETLPQEGSPPSNLIEQVLQETLGREITENPLPQEDLLPSNLIEQVLQETFGLEIPENPLPQINDAEDIINELMQDPDLQAVLEEEDDDDEGIELNKYDEIVMDIEPFDYFLEVEPFEY